MNEIKYSEHCDKLKLNHSKCVDEKQSEEKFLTDNFISFFMSQRGCSWQTAIGHAMNHLKSLEK